MTLPPDVIVTPRLVLRRPALADAPAIYEYARDPEVTRYMDWPTHTDLRDTIAFLQACGPRWQAGEEWAWVLTIKPNDTAVGSIGCRLRGEAAEIGYVLDRRYWRQGYVGEAARAVVAWAFGLEPVSRVWAMCDTENLVSARVLQKLGMRRTDILRRSKARPNLGPELRDAFVYAISKGEWRLSN